MRYPASNRRFFSLIDINNIMGSTRTLDPNLNGPMQLTVPQRTVADAESFPVDPDGVNRWLSKLNPTQSTSDAMEVYRGLRHSNRLHNDLNRRRAVVACFIPTLRDLNTSLLEICRAQPMPLTNEFQRSAQLLDGFLREEAFAFKILLADSPQPRGDDVRRAMQALARQAKARIHGYKSIPESLLKDANQLYELAEEFSLLDNTPEAGSRSTAENYKTIMLLSLADCKQHRVRQLPLLIEFLSEISNGVRIRNKTPTDSTLTDSFVLHLKYGTKPVPATSLLSDTYKHLRWFNLSAVLKSIDVQLAKSRSQDLALLGAESLDRQTFARLRVTFARTRQRRSQRTIQHDSKVVVLGHKSICAHLQLSINKAEILAAESPGSDLASGYAAMNKLVSDLDNEDKQTWFLINQSTQGAALFSPDCRAGVVQVGELISIEAIDAHLTAHTSGRSNAMIGVVRWVTAEEGSAVRFGIEYLAKGVLPVGISRTHSDDIIADDAMIIACKVKNTVMQTILLPAYLYQPGDRLTVALNKKQRHVKLNKSLQNNGLFSHFSMLDTESA